MHQHNPNLIMALAEGQLAPSDAAAAEAEFAACTECSADLKAQRLALEVLHAAPAAKLTATERLGLHDALRRELRLTEDLEAAPAAPQRRRRWTAGWAFGGAAAVLVAVLAVAPGLRLISQGDEDSAAEISALTTQAVTTTTAAFSTGDAPALSSGDAAVPGATDMGDAAVEEMATTTVSPEATATAPSSLEDRVALETGESPEVRLNEFFSTYERAAGDPEIAVQLYAKGAPLTTPAPGPTSCTPPLDLMTPDAAVSFTVAVVLIDRVQVPVIGYAVPGQAEIVLVVFDPETCDVIFSLP